jgi:hypothetical protein
MERALGVAMWERAPLLGGEETGVGMDDVARGSDRLREAYRAGGFVLDEGLVDDLADRLQEIDLHDVLVKGQPVPDVLRATFAVADAERGGAVITELLNVFGRRDGVPMVIRVFPRGIPWPGEFNVDILVNERH